MKKLSWGILGTGDIACTFAKAIIESKTGKITAVGSRTLERSESFGQVFGISKRYGSYDALLADDSVEAVYIASPHSTHVEWSIKAAEAGKHVLCEKPIALNYLDALKAFEAAKANDVFLMEGFMYRCHPQTEKIVELIQNNVIGKVRMIYTSFGFTFPYDATSRHLNRTIGGGAIYDVGCYCVSMARLVAGVSIGQSFSEPMEMNGSAYIGNESGVDEWAAATMKFPQNIVATLATAIQVRLDNALRIFGSEGEIYVPNPWVPARDPGKSIIQYKNKEKNTWQELTIETNEGLYTLEANAFAAGIMGRKALFPAMNAEDSLGNMKAIGEWRRVAGCS